MRRFCERCTEEDVPEAKSPSPLNAEQFTIFIRVVFLLKIKANVITQQSFQSVIEEMRRMGAGWMQLNESSWLHKNDTNGDGH